MDAILSTANLAFLRAPDDAAAAGIMALGCFFWAVIMIVALGVLAFQIWLFWRIFTKAGYNGAMSLLILIPGIGAIIVLCMLAFGHWPALRDRA
ncbi:MAG TPA: hypothetical protein VFF77_02885 [Holophagaceae bacterium]|jgi:hypothetical protein|nr:hypothetical protein [Holophagaceae bacterium]